MLSAPEKLPGWNDKGIEAVRTTEYVAILEGKRTTGIAYLVTRQKIECCLCVCAHMCRMGFYLKQDKQ